MHIEIKDNESNNKNEKITKYEHFKNWKEIKTLKRSNDLKEKIQNYLKDAVVLEKEKKKIYDLIEKKLTYYKLSAEYDENNETYVENLLSYNTILEVFSLNNSDFETDHNLIKTCNEYSIWYHNHCYMHIDLDCFYTAVEINDNPSLKGKPVAVGNYMMICTANYEARAYGVFAGTPMYLALQKCPNLITLSVNMDKYKAVSKIFFDIIYEIDPQFLSLGLDEVTMDISKIAAWKSIKDLEIFTINLRRKIEEFTYGCTCSAGVANTRLLSKLIVKRCKPNGHYILDPKYSLYTILTVHPTKLTGIGQRSYDLLNQVYPIYNIFELLKSSYIFSKVMPKKWFSNILDIAIGVKTEANKSIRKSSGASRSFSTTNDLAYILNVLEIQITRLIEQLNILNATGNQLVVNIRDEFFRTQTITGNIPYLSYDILLKSSIHMLVDYIKKKQKVLFNARKIYEEFIKDQEKFKSRSIGNIKLRLIGVSIKNLTYKNLSSKTHLSSYFVEA